MKRTSVILVNITIALFFAIMLFINYSHQAEISTIAQINKPLIQPANYTFAIWSVIYGWFLCWIIYSFFKTNVRDELYLAVRFLLPLNFTFNACWVLTYSSNQILLSCIFIVAVLITSAMLFHNTRKFYKLGWFNIGVFSVYLGWISVATIVNIFYFVNNLSPAPWTTLEQIIWTTIALIILLLFALFILIRKQDILLPVTLIWALIGIGLNGANKWITDVSFSISIFIFVAILFGLLTKK